MVSCRSRLILCVAAFLTHGCLALQYVTTPQPAASFAQKASARETSGNDGIVQAVVSRVQDDFQVLMSFLPKPATKALGFVQEEQVPAQTKEQQEQAQRDFRNGMVLQCIFIAIVALIYHEYKARPAVDASFSADMKDKLNGEFESGYFSCFNDMNSCLMGFCCPLVIWADNMDMPRILTFWTAVAIGLGLVLGNVFINGVSLILIGIMVWGRGELRKKFHMPFGTIGVYAEDCLCLWCCLCCTVTMDHRHLDAACKAGHEAVGEEKEEKEN